MRLVGNQPFLGSWQPKKAVELRWTEGNIWKTEARVPVGTEVEFKVRCGKRAGTSSAGEWLSGAGERRGWGRWKEDSWRPTSPRGQLARRRRLPGTLGDGLLDGEGAWLRGQGPPGPAGSLAC